MTQVIKNNEALIVNKSQLMNFFHNGIKDKADFKIGIEFEKIGVRAYDHRFAPYSGENGIQEFLRRFNNKGNWNFVLENNNIMGLENESGTISLEPGSQVELSCSPKDTIHEIYDQLNNYNSVTSELGEDMGIHWLGYGIQPLSTYNEIELIPKGRYHIMNEYLPTKGSMDRVMMRETAGIQISIDYESEEDAINKFKISLGLSPIVTAMFSNSPIREGKETNYKSYRAHGWINTDADRCGLVSKKIFDSPFCSFSFCDYVGIILDLPMIFLFKDNRWINMKGLTFRKYLENGYEGYKATMTDWNLHMTSFFPEVRLKNFLEIRNCDCQRSDIIPAVPALWKGLMYNNDAMEAAWDLVKDLSWEERLELRNEVPKHALNTQIGKLNVLNAAKELVKIANYSLKQNSRKNIFNQDESVYLEQVHYLLADSKTPADLILENWNGEWNRDIRKLAEYSRLT